MQDLRKIKITKSGEDVFFATQVEKLKDGFPLHYLWFSKLVCNKLTDLGYDV